MSTQAAPVLHGARVARAWDESPILRGLLLETPETPGATAPGQYLKAIVAPGVEGFFALSSAPEAPLELLVRRGAGPAADELAALESGAELRVTAPMGLGFPVREHTGHDLVLLAAGSGIAPMRGVVTEVLRDRDRYGKVRLFYGQRTASDFAYENERPGWERSGIDVVRVASDPDPSWTGPRGWVQDAFRADPGELSNAVLYVCGMRPFVLGAFDVADELGIDRERLFLNV